MLLTSHFLTPIPSLPQPKPYQQPYSSLSGTEMIKVEKIGDPKEAIALGHAAGKEIKNIAGPVKFAEYGAAVAEVQAAAGTTSTPISPISSVPSPPFQYYPHLLDTTPTSSSFTYTKTPSLSYHKLCLHVCLTTHNLYSSSSLLTTSTLPLPCNTAAEKAAQAAA